MATFKEGLKDQVQDLLIMIHPKPTKFNYYVKIYIKIDNTVHENEMDKWQNRSDNMPKTSNTPLRQIPTPTALSIGEPMQIDTIKTK